MPTLDRTRRSLMQAAVATSAAIALPTLGQGSPFPARPIRLICPWPPGGATDAVMRAMGESAGKALGGQVLIENKAGASGMLGPNELVTSKPDGYTLSQLTIGVARLPHMQKTQFDPLKDFTYIVCLTGYTFGLVVRADSPIKSIQDLVDYAKANPEKFSYGSPGVGTTLHLAVEEFASKAGIRLLHVPFKGFADGMQAMLGGHTMAHSDSTRLGAARGRRHRPLAGHVRLQARQALAQRANTSGTGLRDRIGLAVRDRWPPGDGADSHEASARRLQGDLG